MTKYSSREKKYVYSYFALQNMDSSTVKGKIKFDPLDVFLLIFAARNGKKENAPQS